jgi:hypothetical protein
MGKRFTKIVQNETFQMAASTLSGDWPFTTIAIVIFLYRSTLGDFKNDAALWEKRSLLYAALFVISLTKFHAKVSYESTFEYTGLSEASWPRDPPAERARRARREQTAPAASFFHAEINRLSRARETALINWLARAMPTRIEKIAGPSREVIAILHPEHQHTQIRNHSPVSIDRPCKSLRPI